MNGFLLTRNRSNSSAYSMLRGKVEFSPMPPLEFMNIIIHHKTRKLSPTLIIYIILSSLCFSTLCATAPLNDDDEQVHAENQYLRRYRRVASVLFPEEVQSQELEAKPKGAALFQETARDDVSKLAVSGLRENTDLKVKGEEANSTHLSAFQLNEHVRVLVVFTFLALGNIVVVQHLLGPKKTVKEAQENKQKKPPKQDITDEQEDKEEKHKKAKNEQPKVEETKDEKAKDEKAKDEKANDEKAKHTKPKHKANDAKPKDEKVQDEQTNDEKANANKHGEKDAPDQQDTSGERDENSHHQEETLQTLHNRQRNENEGNAADNEQSQLQLQCFSQNSVVSSPTGVSVSSDCLQCNIPTKGVVQKAIPLLLGEFERNPHRTDLLVEASKLAVWMEETQQREEKNMVKSRYYISKIGGIQAEISQKRALQNTRNTIRLLYISFALTAITWLFTLRYYTTELTWSGVSERALLWWGSLFHISLAWESSTWLGFDVIVYRILAGVTGVLVLYAVSRVHYGVHALLALISYVLFATSFLRLVTYYFAPLIFAFVGLLYRDDISFVSSGKRFVFVVCTALGSAVVAGYFAALSDPLNMERQLAFMDRI